MTRMNPKGKGVSIILYNGNRILMQHRDDKKEISYPDHWGMFGGHAEDGEEPEDCLIRELKEELELEIESPKMLDSFDCPDTGRTEYIFSYEIGMNTGNLQLNEGQEMAFLSVEEMRKKRIVPWHLPVIKKFFWK